MVVRVGNFLAGLVLAGMLVAGQTARGEAPPLRPIDPLAYPDQPAGMKYGPLVYNASLMSGMVWDSNIFSSKEHIIADRIQFVRPGLTVTTLDPNYRFVLRAGLDHLAYDLSPSEDRTDARGELRGAIRVQRDAAIDVGAFAARVSEPRSVQRRDLPGDAASPVVHNQYSAWIGLRKLYNPLVWTTLVTVENDNYFNVRSNSGGTINLQYLDRDVAKVSQTFDVRLSHRLALFSAQRLTTSVYRNEPGFIQRDSVKFDTLNGVEVAFTPLIKGKFSFQFGEEHFWATAIEGEPELTYRAELAWLPRRNIRITTGLARDFGGVNFDLDSNAGRRTRADIVLDYEITRQLFFRSSFGYLHANEASIATGSGRLEDTYLYKVSLGYELTRYWLLYLDYAYERRDALSEADEFQRQIIQTGVIARF
jgi:hypothetical protein